MRAQFLPKTFRLFRPTPFFSGPAHTTISAQKMSDCLFCKIRDGKIPAKILHRDEVCIGFEDVSPQAPVHFLVIPQKHIPTVNDIEVEDQSTIGHMYGIAARLAKERGVADDGYRLVMNCNAEAGQTVYHIHLHVLGGRPMRWPPG
eukprot:TRINITY_DN48096_c0_g1_i1.p2 TRINITY_DN48096_c0_g1~~TRINITY_DN48096_c0_g1_i1.p2  ORF type:complete len:146 (-),score=4.52 TRINITY_DN48096_c0_g1_i1:183-620(-)